MSRRVVVVTGAAGFIGSAVVRDLARDHYVVAIDRRDPAPALRAEPAVAWHRLDIADRAALSDATRAAAARRGRVDVVLHLAAYYHFDPDWRDAYRRTNVDGTSRVIDAAVDGGAGRLIFASSMLAMPPAPAGEALTERSPAAGETPYGKSKAIGERIVGEQSGRLPAITLRIGGVFSDWCELPPLASLLRRWTGRSPASRIVVGAGETGMPYIHRRDLVRLIRGCIARHEALDPHEVLLASQHGCVSHRDLWAAVRGDRARPLYLSPRLARAGLAVERGMGRITGRMPFERPWMLGHVDRPWVADTTTTREKLDWDVDPALGVVARMPVLLKHLSDTRAEWKARQAARVRDRETASG